METLLPSTEVLYQYYYEFHQDSLALDPGSLPFRVVYSIECSRGMISRKFLTPRDSVGNMGHMVCYFQKVMSRISLMHSSETSSFSPYLEPGSVLCLCRISEGRFYSD
jgi:hypothetical protein